MAVKKSEDQFRVLLVETILAMCRNTLNYDSEVSVEGLIGITLDKEEIFLVTINQLISNPDAVSSTGKRKRKRKRKSKRSQDSNSDDNDSDNQSGTEDESNKRSRQQSGDSSRQEKSSDKDKNSKSKSDRDQKNGEGTDDLVFLKEEPGASSSSAQDNSSQSYSFPNVAEALASSSQASDPVRRPSQNELGPPHQRDSQYLSPGSSRPDHPIPGPSQAGSNVTKQAVPLWEFILEMLCNPQFNEVLSWTGNGWEFRISRPGVLAQIWGEYKGFPKMNYDNLSRSLRQYYQRNIIKKTRGKMYAYHFTDSVAMKKFNMTPQEVFDAYNVWPRPSVTSGVSQSSMPPHNAPANSSDFFPTDGAHLHNFSPEGSTNCMTSPAAKFKCAQNQFSRHSETDDKLLIDFDGAVCYPADLNQIKREEFSDSDENV